VWFDSDTNFGETVNVEYRVAGNYTEVAGSYDNTTHAGVANWYADIPAKRDGTTVDYQTYLRNNGGDKYAPSDFIYHYTVSTSPSVSATAPVNSAPAAFGGHVYFGSDDGRLYGFDAAARAALAGFPFDATASAGTGARILGRPAVRIIAGKAYLFFLTDNGYIGRLGLNGDGSLDTTPNVTKMYQPDPTATNVSTTPAVFMVGGQEYIFAAVNTATGARLLRVPEDTMSTFAPADFGPTTTVSSSPAGGADTNIYVGISGTPSGVIRVGASSMSQLASYADGQSIGGSPYISGTTGFFQATPVIYVGTDSGEVFAANAINGDRLSGFGTDGIAPVTNSALTSVFLFNNQIYTSGASDGKVWKVNAQTGAATEFYNVANEGNGSVRAGLAVDSKDNGYLVWGTDTGRFYQVDVTNANNKRIHTLASDASQFTTPPAIDVVSGTVMAGNADNHVYIFPR
jgi:hypothetical protein